MFVIHYTVFLKNGTEVKMAGKFDSWQTFDVWKRNQIRFNGKSWKDVVSTKVVDLSKKESENI